MRRPLLVGLFLAWVALATAAACSSFSSPDEPAAEGGAGETATGVDGSMQDAAVADVVTKPGVTCPLVPTAPPCTTGCEDQLPALPPPTTAPGKVNDARIAVRRDTVYVARVVDRSVVELFSKGTASTSWALRGTFAASSVFGLAVNDTTILLSLEEMLDGSLTNQQIVEVDVGCDASCAGKKTVLPDSTKAGAGVVTLGQTFYFSSATTLMTLKGGAPTAVGTPIFGGPVVAADCTYVYYSNAFDRFVHRYDETTGNTAVIATDVGIFDAAGFDGPFPGTLGLAAANDSVFATTGSNQLYVMPKDPVHPGQVIVSDAGLGQVIVADGRFVYYAEDRGSLLSAIVRVAPDGGSRQQLSTSLFATAIASDADHLYVVEAGGRVTRLKK
jgi:hypothetical protein